MFYGQAHGLCLDSRVLDSKTWKRQSTVRRPHLVGDARYYEAGKYFDVFEKATETSFSATPGFTVGGLLQADRHHACGFRHREARRRHTFAAQAGQSREQF